MNTELFFTAIRPTIRTLIQLGCGVLIREGTMNESQVEILTGGIIAIGTFAWSYYDKRQTLNKLTSTDK